MFIDRLLLLLPFSAVVFLSGCASPSYEYKPVPGRTADLHEGRAYAPTKAPPVVHAAIAAGNRIAGLPYRRGGGHRVENDTAYDCSGAASYVLREAGLLASSMPSKGFRRYGQSGEGKWISIYARKGHVFLVVAGLRFDTGLSDHPDGPHWTTTARPAKGCVIRHPKGL
jgi:hypothetical protein